MRPVFVRYLRERWGLRIDYDPWLFLTYICLILFTLSLLVGIALVLAIPYFHYLYQDTLWIYLAMAMLIGSVVVMTILLLAYFTAIVGRCLWGKPFFHMDRLLSLEESSEDPIARIDLPPENLSIRSPR